MYTAQHWCLSMQCSIRRMQNGPWVRSVSAVLVSWAVVIPEQLLLATWPPPSWAFQLASRQSSRCDPPAEEGKLSKWRAPPGSAQPRAGPTAVKLGSAAFPCCICKLLFSSAPRMIWVLRMPACLVGPVALVSLLLCTMGQICSPGP